MGNQRKSFPLRIAKPLFDELKRWADQEMRSVNSQIEYLLHRAVQSRRGATKPKSHNRKNESRGPNANDSTPD